jgi:hypothetical protein
MIVIGLLLSEGTRSLIAGAGNHCEGNVNVRMLCQQCRPPSVGLVCASIVKEGRLHGEHYTPLSQWFLAPARLNAYQRNGRIEYRCIETTAYGVY